MLTKTLKKKPRNSSLESKEKKIEHKLWKKRKLEEQLKIYKEIEENEIIKLCNLRYRDFDPE